MKSATNVAAFGGGRVGSARSLIPPLLIVALLLSREVRAESTSSTVQSRAALTLDTRGEIGTGTVGGIELGAVGAGVEWRLVPTLRLRTIALVLGAAGTTDTGRSANPGAGGELAARLLPFPGWTVRPYMRISAGFLLFLRRPFLPGGDFYDFILGLGVGVEIPVGSRWSLIGDLHATHLSNDQGIGPFNPAFNGYGGIVGVNYALAPGPSPSSEIASVSNAASIAESAGGRSTWTPGVVVDADAGHTTTSLVFGGRVRVAERITRRYLAELDVESESIGGTAFEEAGLGLVGHWAHATVGLEGTYQHLPGIDAIAEQVQLEAHISPEASLIATGISRQQSVLADLITGGFGFRMFPIDTVRLEGGIALSRSFATGSTLGKNPYWGFEWQLPLRARDWQVSIVAERQLSSVELGGVRFAWGMGRTLRETARHTGWLRLR